jgi:micrococcal nuclease
VPLSRWLRGRHRRFTAAGLGIAVLAAMVVTDRAGLLMHRGHDMRRYDSRSFTVTRVIDGDTLEVRHPDGSRPVTRVQLWGVRTADPADAMGEQAAAYVRELCEGRDVTLHLEPHQSRDDFGRLLAFVELPDGTLLNERLIVEGLARTDSRTSHRHADRFAMLARQARADKRGVWAGR